MKGTFLKTFRLLFFFLGLLGIFVADRYFHSHASHAGLRAVAMLFIVLGTGLAALFAHSSQKAGLTRESKSWWLLFSWQITVTLGVLIYLLYSRFMGDIITPETATQKILLASWLLFIVVGSFAGIGLEVTHSHCGTGEYAEPKRVAMSGMGWLTIGIFTGSLAAFNYSGAKLDKTFDLSYLKTTKPSMATKSIVATLEKPLDIAIFFPRDNDVKMHVMEYMEDIAGANKKITLHYFDKDITPSSAEQYKATHNGQVVLKLNENQTKRIEIGTDLKQARSVLQKLDSKFQEAFLGLTEKEKVVYFTSGHGELTPGSGTEPLRSLKGLELLMKTQQYKLQTFSPEQGGFTKVPDDAAVIVIAAPARPFLSEEVAVLKEYVEKGGHIMVWFDDLAGEERLEDKIGGSEDPLKAYLKEIGLVFNPTLLANDQSFIAATRTKADRLFWFTNSFSAHESVSLLARNEEQVEIISFRSGSFEVAAKPDAGWKIFETIKTPPMTFADVNSNLDFDNPAEKRKPYTIAAALERIGSSTPDKDSAKKGKILAFADSSVFTDALLRNVGNQILLVDSMKWLVDSTKITGAPTSEEDVQIRYSKTRDLYVFYGTIVIVPLLVLVVGFFATRKKKAKRAAAYGA
jgi:hypothetical protein